MLRSLGKSSETSDLVMTQSTVQNLRAITMNFSLRVPILLTSVPSSGKVLLLSHLANQLFPGSKHQMVTIHLADTSLDPRSLLGSYVSSTRSPGTFEWKEGVIVRAMREGKWLIFKDIDRASNEVLGLIKPLVESLGLEQWIGARASLQVPSRGLIRADENFALFATRSVRPSKADAFASPTFFGAHKFHEVVVQLPTSEELETIILSRFPLLPRLSVLALINLWEAVKSLGSSTSTHDIGLRELEKLASRISSILPSSYHPIDFDVDDKKSLTLSTLFPSPTLREEMYLEARDVFFGGGALSFAARAYLDSVSVIFAEHLGLEPARRQWVLNEHTPEFDVETDPNGLTVALRIGRKRLLAKKSDLQAALTSHRPFAMHKPAIRLLSRLATAILLNEPVLLTGETGTGKTSLVSHLASRLRRRLVSLNLSHQTESSDLIGGFKPVDARVLGSDLQEQFIELFGRTFSRRKNVKFEESVKRAVGEQKWKRVVALWKESVRLAKERIQGWHTAETEYVFNPSNECASSREGNYRNKTYESQEETPKKKRKADQSTLELSQSMWAEFERDVIEFEAQYIQAKGRFAFAFVEGPLVKAIRAGDW
jgi:midasin